MFRSLSVERMGPLCTTTHLILHDDIVRLFVVVVVTIHEYVGIPVTASVRVYGALAQLLCVFSTPGLETLPKECFLWLLRRLATGAEKEF